MDQDEYDEFGNLIGDPFDSDAESDIEISEAKNEEIPGEIESRALISSNNDHNHIISVPIEEDTDVPVIENKVEKKLKVVYDGDLPATTYDRSYMINLMKTLPERIRNIAVVGGIKSGKTSFIDLLVLQTHPTITSKGRDLNLTPIRFTDNHRLEINREMSIKLSPISLLLPDTKEKSWILNVIDTPGHVNFFNESIAAMGASEGIVLVLDVVEGLTNFDRKIITHAIRNNLSIVLVLNKIDKLIMELKLPQLDAYYKLNYIIDETNEFIEKNEYISNYTKGKVLSPTLNNVIFASSYYEFIFTVQSFSDMFLKSKNNDINVDEFSQRLWGDYFYDTSKKSITSSSESKYSHTFVQFILNPIYKLIMHTITFDPKNNTLSSLLWKEFGITIPKADYKKDIKCLLRKIFQTVYNGSHGFVNSIRDSIELPTIKHPRQGDNLIIAKTIKLIESSDGLSFSSLVRIFEGSVAVGDKVKVLGESFPENEDDYRIEIIRSIHIPGGRYKVEVSGANAGSLVLIDGIDSIVSKGATILHPSDTTSTPFKIPDYSMGSVMKVAVEPAKPSELPRLLNGLRLVNKAYLSIVIKVEESGEHVVLAPGELHLDCALHDLRMHFTDELQIKVSDPMTKFSETCLELSMTKIASKSPNGHNLISIISEPFEEFKLSKAIEAGKIDLSQPVKVTSKILRNEYGWDALAARSMWSFGPDDMNLPTLLLDDTLETETDKKLLYSLKDSISQGFKWSVNEGPLCDEPIRNAKFKILDAVISGSEIQRSGAQIIPMTRKACYTGFLTATPRLMEPIYFLDVTCTSKAVPAISKLLKFRRGWSIGEYEVPGTPLFRVEGYIPVIESFGFETELRLRTQGQAMCFLLFSNWNVVPGDPLDKTCPLPLLKPAPIESLARDFVMKTRKRKGLSGEPSLQKYVDPEIYQRLIDGGLVRP